jgi:hypothetical protein
MLVKREGVKLVLADPPLNYWSAVCMLILGAVAPTIIIAGFVGLQDLFAPLALALNGAWIVLWLYGARGVQRADVVIEIDRKVVTLGAMSLTGLKTSASYSFDVIDRFAIDRGSMFWTIPGAGAFVDDRPVLLLKNGRRITLSGCTHARFDRQLAAHLAEANTAIGRDGVQVEP